MDYQKWHFGTSVQLDFGTSVSPLFPYCRTNGGCPLSTFGGRIVVQMGDAAIDALSRPSCAHYRTDGGRIVVQMGDAHYQHLGDALSYKWGMLP